MNIFTKITKIGLVLTLIATMGAGCDIFLGSGKVQGAGVLRSANGGTDWQFSTNMKDTKQASIGSASVSALKFKPGAPDVVYASSYDNGMYVSEDGGTTWNQILSKFSITDFAFDPSNADIIYAAGISTNHGRVLVTHDAGKTWQEIYNEATSGNAVQVVLPETSQRIYIGLNDGNIVRSDDGGLSWKLVQNFQSRVTGIKSFNGSLLVLIHNRGMFKSPDGQTFTNTTGQTGENSSAIPFLSAFSNVGSYNAFAVGSGAIYLATNNGLFRSLDQGGTWSRLILPVQDQQAEIRALAASPNNDSLVYTAVGLTIYKSTDGGYSWQTQNSNSKIPVSALLVNPSNPQLVYAGVSNQ